MNVLLVDDNEITLELEALMLENYNLSVTSVIDGFDAVKLAKKNNYSLIFLDVNMPLKSGYEVASEIREFDPLVPIIALSADDLNDDYEYKKSGMSAYLRKPLKLNELSKILVDFAIILKEEIEVIDTDKIFDFDSLKEVIKDEKAILHILQQFLSHHSLDAQLLKEKIKDNDYVGARSITHNIVGISGNLYCQSLYENAFILNTELRQEKADNLANFENIFNETLASISEVLNDLLNKYRKKEKEVDFKILFEEFIKLCSEFDIEATRLFIDNTDLFKENLNENEFEKMRKAVSNYDFFLLSDYFGEEDV